MLWKGLSDRAHLIYFYTNVYANIPDIIKSSILKLPSDGKSALLSIYDFPFFHTWLTWRIFCERAISKMKNTKI